MSEIDAPSNITLQTGEGTKRVTRASNTSDDSSAQQQSTNDKYTPPNKAKENQEQTASHETAVTISTSLSNLEAGSRIVANYQGIDGQSRPLIVSETGTYVVRYDASQQQNIDKIPQEAALEIKILKVDREIEARLIYNDPVNIGSKSPLSSIPVTLELTGLGTAPPKVIATTDQSHLPPHKQTLSYQATDLYRTENIARESAAKMKELPLPATTTNYTLYEKAVPRPDRPAIVRSSIATNALIAQELVVKTTSTVPQNLRASAVKAKADSVVLNVEKILHKNILATVIKNIPKTTINLPEIIQKHLGASTPLDNLKAGHNFTLRIESIAIPEPRPETQLVTQSEKFTPPQTTKSVQPPSKAGPTADKYIAEITIDKPSEAQSPLRPNSDNPVATKSQDQKTPAPAQQELSGIIIAPGQHILKNTDKMTSSQNSTPPPSNQSYPAQYKPSSFSLSRRNNNFITLYVATPVSVIKIQSPIELKPGTVINFSLPTKTDAAKDTNQHMNQRAEIERPVQSEQKNDPKTTAKENIPSTQVSSNLENQPTAWTPTSLVTQSGQSNATPPPQPIENLVHHWQSLNQILSVMPVVDSGNIAQSLNNRVPSIQSPGQMTTSMVFFLAAMGAKNPAKIWLGPVVTQQLAKAGQGKLLAMLDNDMQRIFRLGTETAPNDWRPALIPMQVGGEVHAIPILTRQLPHEEGDNKNNTGDDDDNENVAATRFIVELDLSQFGQIQVDGLLKEKKLNIIIRSKIIIPTEMQQKMIGMFTTALEISGYSGDLQFKDNVQPDISVQNIITQRTHMSGLS